MSACVSAHTQIPGLPRKKTTFTRTHAHTEKKLLLEVSTRDVYQVGLGVECARLEHGGSLGSETQNFRGFFSWEKFHDPG